MFTRRCGYGLQKQSTGPFVASSVSLHQKSGLVINGDESEHEKKHTTIIHIIIFWGIWCCTINVSRTLGNVRFVIEDRIQSHH